MGSCFHWSVGIMYPVHFYFCSSFRFSNPSVLPFRWDSIVKYWCFDSAEGRSRVSQARRRHRPPKQETRGQRHHGFPRRRPLLFERSTAWESLHVFYKHYSVCTFDIREEESVMSTSRRKWFGSSLNMMFFWLNSNNLFVDTLKKYLRTLDG
jgi:hypothetical protein